MAAVFSVDLAFARYFVEGGFSHIQSHIVYYHNSATTKSNIFMHVHMSTANNRCPMVTGCGHTRFTYSYR